MLRTVASRIRPILLVAAGVLALVSACSSTSPTGPRQVPSTPTPDPPPPPRPNDAPVITSLVVSSPRAEAGNDLTVTASVQDAETPIDQLTFGWSATPANGEFVGTGAQVRWRAPHQQRSPDLYAVKLVVTERYASGTQTLQNETTKSIDVHYNDSPAEVNRIGMRFLTELFPDFSVPPQQAVQDFSDSCQGKRDELSDVTNNRINFHILSGTYTNVAVNVNADRTAADVSGICTFVDIPTNPSNPNVGRRESVTGVCTLTAVYENWRWFLCSSHFRGLGTVPLGGLKYRVPGQIVPPTE
jgi:hypothetical protein